MKQLPFLLKILMALSLAAVIGSSLIWFDRQNKLLKMAEQLEAESDIPKRSVHDNRPKPFPTGPET